jgi:hypothetical protein
MSFIMFADIPAFSDSFSCVRTEFPLCLLMLADRVVGMDYFMGSPVAAMNITRGIW